ncbi:16S rRNA (uracil(1498)-N(3))-methyltransferase [Arcanobacterium bovis]|uniref:Ribosomal RNA small subunit methyltransferase E n=1 Tax=Arcanobacterium bovis TaxID=2529275 RepID=A0A4Q9V0A0_9ACTO|nr:16S rRNA (uracil(1498)-N(3))-methyltransferase [Arcanobacterium bovis]TBW22006.1 16S rRNA (uracil(1498)-N(3))-methyltransferase [Arcanobacterium bovis]
MTLPVYIDRNLQQPRVGDVVVLSGDEARHAATVRRTRCAERIDIVDGRGLRVTVEVDDVAKNQLSGTALEVKNEKAPDVRIILVQALAKGGRDEQAVETSTEFGVDEVVPWESQRAIVTWSQPGKASKGTAKWQLTADAAAKQSRRSYVPVVHDVVKSRELAAKIGQWVANDCWVLVCHEEARDSLVQHLRTLVFCQGEGSASDDSPEISATMASLPAQIVVIVGPEGGIAPEEIELFTGAGAQPVLLGEHVLRSATAGSWAIAVLRAFTDAQMWRSKVESN